MRTSNIVAAGAVVWTFVMVAMASRQPEPRPTPATATATAIAHCSPSVLCPNGLLCDNTMNTGLCVAHCVASCPIGQVAYQQGSTCACVDGIGPGSPCASDAECATGSRCQNFVAIWGRSPPGAVCVPNVAPSCDAANACASGTCARLVSGANGAGRCITQCVNGATSTPCRFDEVAVGSGAACACKPRDPVGRACASDPDCGWLAPVGGEPARVCQATGNSKHCLPAGTCAAADVCGNGLDDECDGRVDDRAPTTGQACGCGGAFQCDGSCSAPGPGNLGQPCGCNNSGTIQCNGACSAADCPVCQPRVFFRDADGDGYGNPRDSVRQCDQPAGYVADGSDCDDTRGNRHPGAAEVCGDGVDNDCNGVCEDGCLQRVYEKALCGGTNYMLCNDNMLTSDPSEGPAGAATSFLTYKQPVAGVTDNRQLLRCVGSAGLHFVSIGENNCSNIEAKFGYLMSSFHPIGMTLIDCYANSRGQQIELAEWSRSATPNHCIATPANADGAWKMFGVFGYTPPETGSNPISSCWGQ